MAILNPISVNGASFSWGNIKMIPIVSVGGAVFSGKGFTAISYSEDLDEVKGTVMGSNRAPTKRSQGEYAAEASVTGYQADVEEYIAFLGSQGQGVYSRVEFNIVVVFANPRESVHEVTLHRCRVKGVSSVYAAGPDLLSQDLTLSVMSISRNGMTLHER